MLERHPTLVELIALFRERHPEVLAQVAPTEHGYIGAGRAPAPVPAVTRSGWSASSATCSTRTSSSARTASARSRATTSTTRSSSTSDGQEYRVGYLPGRVRHRDVRRQLELARAGLDAGQRAASSAASCNLHSLLRRRLHGRVPHRLRQPHDAASRSPRRSRAGSSRIFLRDANGRRPVYGGAAKFQDDPHWRDLILFYEYFHGDNGAGLGASHQTGWTGLVARLIDLFGRLDATADVDISRDELIRRTTHEQAVGAARSAG